MKIKVIVPVTTKEFVAPTREEVEKFASKGTEIDVEAIEYGTASIESSYDEMLVAPGIIKVAEKAQSDGFDGVITDCMCDPALDALREKLDIPVVGPGSISILCAADLAHRFSIVTVLENALTVFENKVMEIGLGSKLASVRFINIPVLDLTDVKKLTSALVDESIKAIAEDGAHAIVLGCTGMLGVADDLSDALKKKGYGVPVIYPVAVAVKYLEMLIALGLKQSKKTYMPPPDKERNILGRL
ncbi:MAG: aspartate/glutamate racemase family protein [Dehalococcoidia bacterium]|nr:aspartate/glutamate racemase family protein [Dehalococcoidia bacterium]